MVPEKRIRIVLNSHESSMANLARNIGFNHAADILGKILVEDKAADALLMQIAENNVNYQLN